MFALKILYQSFKNFFLFLRILRIRYRIKKIGINPKIGANVKFLSLDKIVIGNNFYCNFNVILDGIGGLIIGDDVLLGPNVSIYTSNHNFQDMNLPINKQGSSFESVLIGDDVWIGDGAIILPGVTIGSGSIIGAGSIVTKNIGKGEVWAGNPAKFIKYRGL